MTTVPPTSTLTVPPTSTLTVPATTPAAQADRPTDDQRRAYATFAHWRTLAFLAATLSLNLALVLTGVAAHARDALGGGATFTSRLAFLGAYLAFTAVIMLPMDYLLGYRRDVQAGLLTLSGGAWLRRWMQGTLIGSGVQGALYLALTTVFQRFPHTWLPAAVAVITAFLLALAVAQPWLSRRLARLTPLDDARVQRVAAGVFARAGVHLRRISVAHISDETRASSAFVQPGLGGAELVLTDTLLRDCADDELGFVIAHELGHYVRRDLWRLLGWQWVSLIGMTAAAAGLLNTLGSAGGLNGPGDIAALPVLALAFTLSQRLLNIAGYALKRHMEYRADAYALTLTRNPDAMRRVLDRLCHSNMLSADLGRAEEILFHDHPSVNRRLQAATR